MFESVQIVILGVNELKLFTSLVNAGRPEKYSKSLPEP
jgi:hypothetical protein